MAEIAPWTALSFFVLAEEGSPISRQDPRGFVARTFVELGQF
jgi:hypothetical protein